jgi:hypothetical protein
MVRLMIAMAVCILQVQSQKHVIRSSIRGYTVAHKVKLRSTARLVPAASELLRSMTERRYSRS